jgi:hypothetical protein
LLFSPALNHTATAAQKWSKSDFPKTEKARKIEVGSSFSREFLARNQPLERQQAKRGLVPHMKIYRSNEKQPFYVFQRLRQIHGELVPGREDVPATYRNAIITMLGSTAHDVTGTVWHLCMVEGQLGWILDRITFVGSEDCVPVEIS